MKARGLFAGVAVSCLVAAQVPLEREPRHHLEFANDSLRVISPQIPPGDITLEHFHTHDDATVCVQSSSTRAKPPGGKWGAAGMPCVLGRVNFTEYTGNPRSHTVQNVGSGVYQLLLVENLRDSGWTDHPALDIPGAKMVRENRSFRIYDAELSGSGPPSHPPSSLAPLAHLVPTVVVLVSGEVTVGGKRLDQPGQWMLIPTGEASPILARGDTHIVEIEVR